MKGSQILQSLAAARCASGPWRAASTLRTSASVPSPSSALLPSSLLSSTRSSFQPSNAFSTSPHRTMAARNDKRNKVDPRITLIRYHLQHPLTPRPLRLGRLRSLRHWTIHRAFLLHRRQTLEARERELERQYNSMRNACEALRMLEGDGGRLFRIAMEKKGIKNEGVPVEYARVPTEWPAKAGWNHGWARDG